MLTIEQAIEQYDGYANVCMCHNLTVSQKEFEQLAEWLRELVERRKAPKIVRCGECKHFQCNIRFDGSIPKGADEYECRHWCGGCDPMDYCSYGERSERRTE